MTLDYSRYDGYLSPEQGEPIPEPLTEEAAARFAKVTRRTIREWRANGSLSPIPHSLRIMGQWFYWPADVVAAEKANRNGRPRRRGRR